jgi:hypothetical protein
VKAPHLSLQKPKKFAPQLVPVARGKVFFSPMALVMVSCSDEMWIHENKIHEYECTIYYYTATITDDINNSAGHTAISTSSAGPVLLAHFR